MTGLRRAGLKSAVYGALQRSLGLQAPAASRHAKTATFLHLKSEMEISYRAEPNAARRRYDHVA